MDQRGKGQNLKLNPPTQTVAHKIRNLQISYIFQISYSTLIDWIASNLLIYLVRMKGLEPSHPCEYMDLNHARLPIPPHPHVCTTGRKLYLFKPRTRSQPFAIPAAPCGRRTFPN